MRKKIVGITICTLFILTILSTASVNSESIEQNDIDTSGNYCDYLQDKIDDLEDQIEYWEYYLYDCIWQYFFLQENYHGDFKEEFDALGPEGMDDLEQTVQAKIIHLQMRLLTLQRLQALFCSGTTGDITATTQISSTQSIETIIPLHTKTTGFVLLPTSSATSSSTSNCPCSMR